MIESTDLKTAVLATVTYGDLFDFPLTSAEIHRFLIGKSATLTAVQLMLDRLILDGELETSQSYYMLPERCSLVPLRNQRTVRAVQMWRLAERYAKWISRLPFVRMITVTGSLAVDNPTANADIDYLIVTSNDRLWLCRLFVIGVVHLAARQGVDLCPNYFLSERALALAEHDIYTGRELMQMRPLFGKSIYYNMVTANNWVKKLLPNSCALGHMTLPLDEIDFRPKRWLEKLLGGRVGAWLEQWAQRRKMVQFAAAAAHIAEAQFSPDRCKGHITAHGALTKQRFEDNQPSILANQPNR